MDPRTEALRAALRSRYGFGDPFGGGAFWDYLPSAGFDTGEAKTFVDDFKLRWDFNDKLNTEVATLADGFRSQLDSLTQTNTSLQDQLKTSLEQMARLRSEALFGSPNSSGNEVALLAARYTTAGRARRSILDPAATSAPASGVSF